jgi:HTH-type transcriptional regulator, competence development regulator
VDTDSPVLTFGQRLRQLRRERSLTQRQLAERTGVDFTYLSKLENDRLDHTPSLKTLRALAEALDADELDLMEYADKVPPFFEAIARNKEALRVFRRAAETIKTPEGWRALLRHIETDAGASDETMGRD